MRCFIAIDLPEEIKEELLRIQKWIFREDTKLKFIEHENLHLTLKFLGEITDSEIQNIKEKLNQINFQIFKVKLANAGVFPSESYIRVIWIGLEPEEKVLKLQQEVDNKLLEVGFIKEKQFSAHITLARVRFVKDKAALLNKLKEIKVKPIEFSVNSFKLKKSMLTQEGPIYEDVLEFKI